jgi:hypothetical protein
MEQYIQYVRTALEVECVATTQAHIARTLLHLQVISQRSVWGISQQLAITTWQRSILRTTSYSAGALACLFVCHARDDLWSWCRECCTQWHEWMQLEPELGHVIGGSYLST